MDTIFLGRWDAIRLVHPDLGYDFEPGEWGMEFFTDGKMTVYLEGEPAGTYTYTFRDGMLTIDGGVAVCTEISHSEFTVYETDGDSGMTYFTIYKRCYEQCHGVATATPKVRDDDSSYLELVNTP